MIQRTIIASVATFLAITLPLQAQSVAGWRMDGTGRFPAADPPTTWGPEKNVFWKTKMPNFSVASPVIVGERIFVCSEPTTLICLNKSDGKILWQKESTYAEIPWSEEDKEKLKAERALADVWSKQQSTLEKQLNVLTKSIADDKAKAKELKKPIDDLRKTITELREKRKGLALLMRATPPYRDGTAGYSQCTPVSDGKHVYVMFGNGLVACYDLEGTRRWLKLMEHSTADYGHGSSPALVGGKLIVHYADLVALDVKDGAESWRLKIRPLHGTCIPTRIGNDDAVFSPSGYLVRVSDGKILADKLGPAGDNAPILHDDIAYYISNSARAFRIPTSLTQTPESLWKASLKGGDYWFASPIYHDGLIYAVNGNCNYSVLDAKTGKIVFFDRLDFGGRVYPSICVAGKNVYVSSDNGTTIVLASGSEYKEIARNTLETFRSSPIFEGRRMYVRTLTHLWCIGQ